MPAAPKPRPGGVTRRYANSTVYEPALACAGTCWFWHRLGKEPFLAGAAELVTRPARLPSAPAAQFEPPAPPERYKESPAHHRRLLLSQITSNDGSRALEAEEPSGWPGQPKRCLPYTYLTRARPPSNSGTTRSCHRRRSVLAGSSATISSAWAAAITHFLTQARRFPGLYGGLHHTRSPPHHRERPSCSSQRPMVSAV